jgi:Xaa-Pro dipeptidase
MKDTPVFSSNEKDRRWSMVRRLMNETGLDCLIVWGESGKWDAKIASVRYLTQIGGNGEESVLVFPREGEPTIFLWNSIMEPFWRNSQDWVKDIRERTKGQTWASCIQGCLADLGLVKGNIGMVSGSLRERDTIPYGMYSDLVKRLAHAQLADATGILETARTIKSPEEILFAEKAGQIGDAMTDALRKKIQPGVKECEVFAEVVRALIAEGGEIPTLVLWGCGQGPEGTGPFAHPGRFVTTRQIQKGDVIIMEMHPKYRGYVIHQERTVFVGEPKKLYRDMYEAGLTGFKKAVEKLTPTFRIGEPVKALRDSMQESGFSYREACIHGHGLESGDPPNCGDIPCNPSECYKPFSMPEVKFAPGMIVTPNIDVTPADWRTSIMLADTYLITEGKPKKLTKYNLQPIVSG